MRYLITSAALLLLTAPSLATETVVYTYDAQGRLVKAAHSGSVNNNVKSEYEHDKSDNRTRKKVTGA
jgi:YD repeat-containing protein